MRSELLCLGGIQDMTNRKYKVGQTENTHPDKQKVHNRTNRRKKHTWTNWKFTAQQTESAQHNKHVAYSSQHWWVSNG